MCSVLKFSRSTYYTVKNRKISKKTQQYQEFGDKVKSIFEASKKRYGAPKIQKELEFSGVPCSLKRVQRHMQRLGIRSIVTRKYTFYFCQAFFANYCEKNKNYKINYLRRKQLAKS